MYFNPITPNSNQNYIPKFKDAGGYHKHQVVSPIFGMGNTIAMSSSPYALSSSGSTVLSSSSTPWYRTGLFRWLGRQFSPNSRIGRAGRAGSNRYGPGSFENPFRIIQAAPQESFSATRRPGEQPGEGLSDGQRQRFYQIYYGYGDPYEGVPIDQIPEDARFASEYRSPGWIDIMKGDEFWSSIPVVDIIADSKPVEWFKETFGTPPGVKRFGIHPETGKLDHYYDTSITPTEYMSIQPLEEFIKYRISTNEPMLRKMATVDTREFMGIWDDQGNLYQVPYNDAFLNDKSLTKQEKADMKKGFIESGTLIDLENTPSNELPKLFYFEEDMLEDFPAELKSYRYIPEDNNWRVENINTGIPYATISNAELKEMYPGVDTLHSQNISEFLVDNEKSVSYTHDLLQQMSDEEEPVSLTQMMFNRRDELRNQGRSDREFK